MAQLGRAPDGVGRTGSFALARLRGSCARLGSLARKAARKPLRSCSPPAPTAPLRSESCSPCAPPDLLVHFLKEKSFCTYGSNDSTRNRDFHLAEHVSFLKKRQKCLSFCLNPLSSLVFAQRISRRERARPTLALNSRRETGYSCSEFTYNGPRVCEITARIWPWPAQQEWYSTVITIQFSVRRYVSTCRRIPWLLRGTAKHDSRRIPSALCPRH